LGCTGDLSVAGQYRRSFRSGQGSVRLGWAGLGLGAGKVRQDRESFKGCAAYKAF
jgi:hypothetical protein